MAPVRIVCRIVAAFILIAASGAQVATSATADFQDWLEQLRLEALAQGVRASTLDRALAEVQPIDRVIELDSKQPEFTQTFWNYLDKRVSPERIARGREMLARHKTLLSEVQRRYGVQPRFLVAFWGLESNYGDNTGSFPVVSATATLAYDARRADFFRQQLLALLKLIDRGDIRFEAKGSWAGAMGQPQFISTTYLSSAVDFDGDGRRDLWTSLPDVFASSANYLAAAGWRSGQSWGTEVLLPAGFDYALTGLENSKSIREWISLGVRDARGRGLPMIDEQASVLLPGGATGAPAFLVYSNFDAILAWNRSVLYAVAVGHLADRLIGEGPFVSPRPEREVPLSRSNVIEIQNLLNQLGFDAGTSDGIVGPKTRGAMKSFQQNMQLPADGFPSFVLLERLRSTAAN
jgi:membrane-bound lytic murein transglycosylase B